MEATALRCSRESQAPGVLNKCLYGEAPLTFNPLPFYTFFFHEKGPVLWTFYRQMVPLSHTLFKTLHPF